MNLQNVSAPTPFAPEPKLGTSSALLAAGDRVTIGAEDERVYRIVHISDQKAWVSPIREGDQRLIRTGELRLVQPMPQPGRLLS